MIIDQEPVSISKEYYKKYAGYVNSTRALASPVDGMKTVYRRMFWTMNDLPKGKMVKSQSIAGALMSLHPHGEQSGVIYSAANSEMKLFDKQGNFGSKILAGSAPRYTECRLNDIGRAFLGGDLINYCEMVEGDLGIMEPKYLPALIPYILTEGNSGMGVGVSSSIPKLNAMDLIDYYVASLTNTEEGTETVRFNSGFTTYVDPIDKIRISIKSGFMKSIESHSTIEVVGNELILKDVPDGVNTGTMLKKFDTYVDQDLLDIRDESKSELRLVFEIVNPKKLSVETVYKLLIKATTKKSSYTYTFEDGGYIYQMNLSQIRDYNLKYLKDCTIRKFTRQYEKAKRDLEVYRVIEYIRTSGLIKELPSLTKEDLYARMPDFEQSSINEAVSKSITRLMNVNTEEEYNSANSKIEEAQKYLDNPNEYLLILYNDFRTKLIKVYSMETTYINDETPIVQKQSASRYIGVTSNGWVATVNKGEDMSMFVATAKALEGRRYFIADSENSGVSVEVDLMGTAGKRVIASNEVKSIHLIPSSNMIPCTNGELSSEHMLYRSKAKKPWIIVNEGKLNFKEV